MKLNNIQKIVHGILNTDIETRASDKLLYYRFLQKVAPATLSMAVGSYLVDRQSNLPSIESISRTRRKVQELYPDLKPDTKVRQIRAVKEEEYKAYAKGE